MSEVLASKKFWDNLNRVSSGPEEEIVFAKLLSRFLKASNSDRVAIEIGCVPGRFLAYVCKRFGYFPEGIDFAEDANATTENTLRIYGLKDYKIYSEEFLSWKASKKYDLVLSFGFIEHFLCPNKILRKHVEILKKDGIIVVEVPNFANAQKLLHFYLDKENLNRHNVSLMNESYFKNVAKNFGLKIEFLGYYGGLFKFFWINKNPTRLQKIANKVLIRISNRTERININNRYFSPFLIMIAKKQ